MHRHRPKFSSTATRRVHPQAKHGRAFDSATSPSGPSTSMNSAQSSDVQILAEQLSEKATERLARRAKRGRRFILANSVRNVGRHQRRARVKQGAYVGGGLRRISAPSLHRALACVVPTKEANTRKRRCITRPYIDVDQDNVISSSDDMPAVGTSGRRPAPSATAASLPLTTRLLNREEHHAVSAIRTGSSSVFPAEEVQFFVEHLRIAVGLPLCKACRGEFLIGQLRIGYVQYGVVVSSSLASVRWLHATTHCIQREGVVARSNLDKVAFCPRVSATDREHLLSVLGMGMSSPSASSSSSSDEVRSSVLSVSSSSATGVVLSDARTSKTYIHGASWHYPPAFREGWIVRPIPDPSMTQLAANPDLVVPSPLASAAALASRVALSNSMRQQRQRLVVRQHARQMPRESAEPRRVETGAYPTHGVRDRTPPLPKVMRLLRLAPSRRLAETAQDTCAICREKMLSGETVRQLPCFHMFHKSCVEPWLRVKGTCPLDNLKLDDMHTQCKLFMRQTSGN